MDELKRARDGAVSYALLSAAGLAPEPVERRIIDLFSAKWTAVMTNVPGPRPAARRHCRHETRAAAELCLLPRC